MRMRANVKLQYKKKRNLRCKPANSTLLSHASLHCQENPAQQQKKHTQQTKSLLNHTTLHWQLCINNSSLTKKVTQHCMNNGWSSRRMKWSTHSTPRDLPGWPTRFTVLTHTKGSPKLAIRALCSRTRAIEGSDLTGWPWASKWEVSRSSPKHPTFPDPQISIPRACLKCPLGLLESSIYNSFSRRGRWAWL